MEERRQIETTADGYPRPAELYFFDVEQHRQGRTGDNPNPQERSLEAKHRVQNVAGRNQKYKGCDCPDPKLVIVSASHE